MEKPYGFIANKNMMHNVLNVEMSTNYAKCTHHEMIMVQLD